MSETCGIAMLNLWRVYVASIEVNIEDKCNKTKAAPQVWPMDDSSVNGNEVRKAE